ncbi:hypothetical protein ABZ570_21485 [Micromonospora sp. NPDC007271]|uniref:hypothetical protein n=1 Tax=Micromonospora sp. NPDC007271 TaxID=3154587 RepID=UPI0033E848C1
MRIIVECKRLASNVYEAAFAPRGLDVFPRALRSEGETSVLLLTEPPVEIGGQLAFAPAAVVVLNRGSSSRVVLVSSSSSRGQKEETAGMQAGDQKFLAELPPDLRHLGEPLLAGVRERWPGNLNATASGRFVETPDNFWTVKIQPRDKSLRLTVRGEPARLGAFAELGLKRDRPGYSTFKISRPEQVSLALQVLRRSRG